MTQHIIASLALIVALIFLANPLDFWMPTEFQLVVAGAIAVIAAVFVGLVYQDDGRDEREVALRGRAARIGYLAGVVVLTLSIIFALCTSAHPDPWVLGALAVMILARLGTRIHDN